MTEQQRIILWVGIGIMALCLFGNDGFRRFLEEAREKRRVEMILVSLRAEHESLTRELALIQKDPSYTEYLIRKNLGYVKKGEVEYRFMAAQKSSDARVQSSGDSEH
jgi:cell division protein FtsB